VQRADKNFIGLSHAFTQQWTPHRNKRDNGRNKNEKKEGTKDKQRIRTKKEDEQKEGLKRRQIWGEGKRGKKKGQRQEKKEVSRE
jgi:hypothetical protein